MQKEKTTAEKLKYALRLNRTLAFVWQAAPAAALASGVLVILQGVFPLAMLYLVKLIVDAASEAISSPGSVNLSYVLTLVAIAAAVALLRTVCQQGASLANETLSMKVADHIYGLLHRKSIAADLEFYENPAYFDTLHRAQMEGPHRPARIVNGLVNLGMNAVSLTAVTGLLVYFHWIVPLILFAAVIPGVLVRIKYSRIMYRWQRDRTETQREASYLNWLITGYLHAKELRLFNLGDFFADRFSELRTTIREEKLAITRKRVLATILAQISSVAAMFGALGFIVYRAVNGMISIGDLVMYYQAIQRAIGYFRSLLGGITGLYEDNLFISYFYEFMDVKEKVKDPDTPAEVPRKMTKGLAFHNVSFTYPLSEKPVLQDISFTIEPGEVVALVGENGAGKSTLIKVLCRLYDPDAGTVTMDGTDLRQYPLTDLRSKIGVMFQDFAKYYFTARKNIWVGDIQSDPEGGKVEASAEKADADTFIKELPQQYDTMLGKMFETGEELSIGQWQKVALARAFMRDAELVVLDEPATSMDAASEYQVFSNFRKLMQDRSAVLISHRFSTVKMADKIVVLHKGRIQEQGSHRELLTQNGPYAEWFEKQRLVAGIGHETVT